MLAVFKGIWYYGGPFCPLQTQWYPPLIKVGPYLPEIISLNVCWDKEVSGDAIVDPLWHGIPLLFLYLSRIWIKLVWCQKMSPHSQLSYLPALFLLLTFAGSDNLLKANALIFCISSLPKVLFEEFHLYTQLLPPANVYRWLPRLCLFQHLKYQSKLLLFELWEKTMKYLQELIRNKLLVVLVGNGKYWSSLALSSNWDPYFFSAWIEFAHPFPDGTARDPRHPCYADLS